MFTNLEVQKMLNIDKSTLSVWKKKLEISDETIQGISISHLEQLIKHGKRTGTIQEDYIKIDYIPKLNLKELTERMIKIYDTDSIAIKNLKHNYNDNISTIEYLNCKIRLDIESNKDINKSSIDIIEKLQKLNFSIIDVIDELDKSNKKTDNLDEMIMKRMKNNNDGS